MFYVPQLPCYKIYKKANHAMQIVWFENESNMGHFHQECVGDFLIRFLEMDLTAFHKAMSGFVKGDEFNFELQFELGYRGVCDKMRKTANLLSSNLHLYRFLIAELEKCFANEEWSDPEQLKRGFMTLAMVLVLREDFGNALVFCLDSSLFQEVSLARKFGGFLQGNPKFRDYAFQTGYAMMPVDKKGNLDYATVRDVNDNEMDLDAQLSKVGKESGGVSLLPFTWIFSYENLLYYDFLELISRGLPVKQCKYCNRYFVQKTKHSTEYCDRKTENGRTCKQVGPKAVFNAQLEKPENTALKEYDRIRKAKQQKLERDRNKETAKDTGKAQAAYDAWSEPAMAARERFVAGEISEEDFLREIQNNRSDTAAKEVKQ